MESGRKSGWTRSISKQALGFGLKHVDVPIFIKISPILRLVGWMQRTDGQT